MELLNLKDTLSIKRFTKSEMPADFRNNVNFQIILIEKGSGKHIKGNKSETYASGDTLIENLENSYRFDIVEETTFTCLQFKKDLFSSKTDLAARSYWLHRIAHINQKDVTLLGDIIKDIEDRKLVWQIHSILLKECILKRAFFQNNISNLVSSILNIVARNSDELSSTENIYESDHLHIDTIIGYIKQHVYDRDRMKVSALGSHFNMKSSTLSKFFKTETGDSIHHYILMYKLELIKYRLVHTDFTVSEIAQQLGFTDESHLTRMFKKYVKITPKQFKTSKINRKD